MTTKRRDTKKQMFATAAVAVWAAASVCMYAFENVIVFLFATMNLCSCVLVARYMMSKGYIAEVEE